MTARFRTSERIAAFCLIVIFSLLLPPTLRAAPATQPAKPVVAVFDLHGELTEQPPDDQLPLFAPPGAWLRDVVTRMKKAADDPDIKAVVVLADGAQYGFAQAEELRGAMQKLQGAGKPIYAHSDTMMMGQYLLLTGASRLSVAPTGGLLVMGLHGDGLYLRTLLNNMGIQPDFLHCGAYKSASEIFMRDGPSPEAEEMMNWLFDSLFDTTINFIAAGRHVNNDQARGWIDNALFTAEQAKANGMIDAVENRTELTAAIKAKLGGDVTFDRNYGAPKRPQVDFTNPFAFFSVLGELMGAGKSNGPAKPAVGVVYVDGAILLGQREAGLFAGHAANSTDIALALDKALADDSVKAVVLRVDSPGGSATASEIIMQATQRLKAKKPLVVSMGDVAGSGGYYVACAADTIFADESTITGSIGVVSGKIVTTDMWHKIGVNWKPYSRGKMAGILSTDEAFSPEERDRLQGLMNDLYGVFKKHVTDIRGDRLKKPIDDIAGGRVYTGKQALALGLVDKIGTLSDAIAFAADQAKMASDYEVRTVPETKNVLQRMMDDANGGENDPSRVEVGSSIVRAETNPLLKAALPLLAGLDEQHVRMLCDALDQLQLVQREGVIMMMPTQAWGR